MLISPEAALGAPAEALVHRRFRLGQQGFPRWAVDAPHRLVWTTPKTGSWQLHARDLIKGVTRQVTALSAGVINGTIDPAGRWIWWFDDHDGSERGVWYRQPFEGGAGEDVGLAPALSTGLALAREFAVVGSCSRDGTILTLVRPHGPPEVVRSSSGHVVVGDISADGSLIQIVGPSTPRSRHPTIAIIDQTGAYVASLGDCKEIDLGQGQWSPVAGDERLLLHHQRHDFLTPMIWSPLDDHVQWFDIDLSGDLTAQWFPDANALLLRREQDGRSSLFQYEIDTEDLAEIRTAPGTVEAAAVRPDGTVWYLHSSGARPARLVAQHGDIGLRRDPADLAGAPYQDLRVGDVHGFTAEPAAARPHPTIFILHGGPAQHDRDAYCPRLQSWIDAGFAAVLVNYRGSTGYGRRWRNAILESPGPGLAELEDLVAVRTHLVGSGFADPHRIVLEGGSWGGFLVLLALGRQPELWESGIAVVPVAEWHATYEDESEAARAHDRALFGGTPDERPDYYAERSPITYAERLRAPVLIIVGRNDPHCPRRQITNYVAQLRLHGKRYELYEFDGGHGSRDIAEQVVQHALQVSFARRSLP